MSTARLGWGAAIIHISFTAWGSRPFGQKLRMGKGVAGVRVGGTGGRFAGGQMIGMAGADALPIAVRGLAHQAVGPEHAHGPAHIPSQVERGRQAAVGVTEKGDIGHPELGAGGPLFLTPGTGHVRARNVPVRTAGIAIGDHAVGDLDPGFDPGRHRSSGPEVHVVGMGGHDQDALDVAGLVKGKNGLAISAGYPPTLSNGEGQTRAPGPRPNRHPGRRRSPEHQ